MRSTLPEFLLFKNAGTRVARKPLTTFFLSATSTGFEELKPSSFRDFRLSFATDSQIKVRQTASPLLLSAIVRSFSSNK